MAHVYCATICRLRKNWGNASCSKMSISPLLVPFWAVWPFEVMVLPHRHIANLPQLTASEINAMADIMRRLTTRYDNLFEISFPYSMGFHQAPVSEGLHPEWHRMPIIIHPCCVLPQCENLWLVLRCWLPPSGM